MAWVPAWAPRSSTYLRRTRNGTAGNGLGTTIKYLQQTVPRAAAWLYRREGHLVSVQMKLVLLYQFF
jgi:hypothetical protein